MGYLGSTIKGVSWIGLLRVITRVLSLGKTLILARILLPAQFGVFGIATLVLALVEVLTETGINIFLVQEKDAEKYINTAWIVSIVRGIIISLFIIVSAPFVSTFFNSPESFNLLLTISIIPFIRGFINPSIVKFQKNLEFNKEFYFRSSIFLTDAIISVVFAVLTQETVSLILGLIAGALLEVVLSFIFISPRPKLIFEKSRAVEIIHRGKWVTAFGVFNYLSQQIDSAVIAKLLNTTSLGIYQITYKLSFLPVTEVTDVVSRVVFPVYSKISSEPKRLFNAFLKTSLIVSVVALPIGALLIIFPREIIILLLGERWLGGVEVLRVLALYGIVRAIFGSASSLFLALKKQNYVAIMTFVRLTGLVITVIPLTLRFGIVGAGYSALFSALLEAPLIVFLTAKIFKSINE